jgi:nucleoside-diphosphate-sugar epimerase
MSGRPTVLVTGGTGFIGRALVDALAAKGHLVRVLGRRPAVRWRGNPAVEHVRADIADPGVIEAALENSDEVYHLAAATSGDADFYHRVTVEGTERLLDALAARGGGRVVFVSSASIYDAGASLDGCVVDEDFPLERNPAARGLYARSKAESELRAHRFLDHPTVKLTIVRPGLVYGPRSKNLLNGAALSLRGKILITTGTPAKLLPLIYIDDLVEALIRIAASDAALGRIYNLAHPQMPTTGEFIHAYREVSGDRRRAIDVPLPKLLPVFAALDRIANALGRKSNYSYTAARLASCPIFSADRMRRDLGFEPRIGFREGLKMSVATQ